MADTGNEERQRRRGLSEGGLVVLRRHRRRLPWPRAGWKLKLPPSRPVGFAFMVASPQGPRETECSAQPPPPPLPRGGGTSDEEKA